MMYRCPNEHRSELRISYLHGGLDGKLWFSPIPKSPISIQRWYFLAARLCSLDKELGESPRDNVFPNLGRMIELCGFMVHESHMDIKDSGKGTSLADSDRGGGYL